MKMSEIKGLMLCILFCTVVWFSVGYCGWAIRGWYDSRKEVDVAEVEIPKSILIDVHGELVSIDSNQGIIVLRLPPDVTISVKD